MKLRATLSLLFIASAVYAQSTLTGANTNPQAGERFVTFNGGVGLAPGNSGANVTWNFSAFTSEGSDTLQVVACNTTPGCGFYAGSNLTEEPLAAADFYGYLSATSSSLSIAGYYDTGLDTSLYTGYTILQYPFTYNSNFTTNYTEDQYSVSMQYNDYDFGQMAVTCDGYGTLITPAGTFQNVVRVHTVTYNTDSTFDMGTIASVSRDTDNSYSWYMPGFHDPLFEIDLYSDGGGTDTSTSYTIQIAESVAAVNSSQETFSLYPNPSKDMLHIKFSITEDQPVTVTIVDLLGRQVAVVGNERYTAGEHQISYNTSLLPKGLYLVQLKSGKENVTKKLEVQ